MAQHPVEQIQSMINNMPEKTGKRLENWFALIHARGLDKHGEIMKLLKGEHGVTHGFANTIALLYRQETEGGPASEKELVATQYAGAKAGLRPLYDEILKVVGGFGNDVEIAPKKAYVSLRRSKQFGIVQPSIKERMDIGLILKDTQPSGRLESASSWNSMCTHRIQVHSLDDLDGEVKNWLEEAYEQA